MRGRCERSWTQQSDFNVDTGDTVSTYVGELFLARVAIVLALGGFRLWAL